MKLIWHPLALEDFIQIIQYCRLSFGIHIARRIKNKYRKDINLLKTQPHLGFVDPLFINEGQLEYRSLIIKTSKIIYTIHTNYIYIHMIWDCRRQPESLSSEIYKRKI